MSEPMSAVTIGHRHAFAIGVLRAFLLTFLALPAAAQFQDLATTGDGSVLYFSSRFRQTGAGDQIPYLKIFRWSREGFDLVIQRAPEQRGGFSNYFQFASPDVSDDGALVTAVAGGSCRTGSSCLSVGLHAPQVLQGRPVEGGFRGGGLVQVSRNGRFLLWRGSGAFNWRAVERIDLETGNRIARNSVDGWVRADRQCITSDGRVLLISLGALSLWDSVDMTSIPVSSPVHQAIVSDDGARAVYERGSLGYPRELWAIRMDGSEHVQLAGAQTEDFHPAISNDGRLAVFVANGRVVVADFATGARRELGSPIHATEATISGNGEVAYAITSRNSLWRIDLLSGASKELVAPVLAPSSLSGAFAPGSLNWMSGAALAPRLALGSAPFGDSLEGVSVVVGGKRAAMIAVSPEQLIYQIPWEAALGSTTIRVSAAASPFEQPPPVVELKPRSPRFIDTSLATGAGFGDVIVDQDFRSLVTTENPARPRDIVHLYATGLGPTQVAVATGELTPSAPLPELRDMLQCRYFTDGGARQLEPLYAGLAPGMVGVYQITIRIPDDLSPYAEVPTHGSLRGECGDWDNRSAASFSVPLRFEE